eukprot:242449_1
MDVQCVCPHLQQSQLYESPAIYPGYIAYNMYHCFNTINDYNTFLNEIRVVGVYESTLGDTRNHVGGAININLQTCSGQQNLEKPLILLLTSHEAVQWSISSNDKYVTDNPHIDTIHILSYYENNTTISLNGNLQSKQIINTLIKIIGDLNLFEMINTNITNNLNNKTGSIQKHTFWMPPATPINDNVNIITGTINIPSKPSIFYDNNN